MTLKTGSFPDPSWNTSQRAITNLHEDSHARLDTKEPLYSYFTGQAVRPLTRGLWQDNQLQSKACCAVCNFVPNCTRTLSHLTLKVMYLLLQNAVANAMMRAAKHAFFQSHTCELVESIPGTSDKLLHVLIGYNTKTPPR